MKLTRSNIEKMVEMAETDEVLAEMIEKCYTYYTLKAPTPTKSTLTAEQMKALFDQLTKDWESDYWKDSEKKEEYDSSIDAVSKYIWNIATKSGM
jgi:hypothetical protein